MEDSAGNKRILDDYESEDRITLREIVLDNRLFARRRYNPVSRNSEWDDQLNPSDIVREFIQEVLSKMGLV